MRESKLIKSDQLSKLCIGYKLRLLQNSTNSVLLWRNHKVTVSEESLARLRVSRVDVFRRAWIRVFGCTICRIRIRVPFVLYLKLYIFM